MVNQKTFHTFASDLTIKTLGSSIVYFLPIIWTVASSGNFNLSKEEAMKIENVQRQVEGKTIRKVIVIKGKVVNFII